MSVSIRQRRCLWRAAIVLIGLVAAQVWLIGPSLFGDRLMLPLDTLAMRDSYLPPDLAARANPPQNFIQTDVVEQLELFRRFAAEQIRAGRLPLWNPHNYGGFPFIAANQSAVFSPFRLLDYAWPSPRSVAWGRLLRMLVAGLGAFLFFRKSMRCAYWPAIIGAWAYPLTGFFLQWVNFPLADVALWLPWLMLGVERSVRHPRSLWPIAVALVTAMMLVCGHIALAAHLLIAAGLFLLWLAVTRRRPLALVVVGAAWVLGGVVSLPQNLPTYEYLQTSGRIKNRDQRGADYQPQGLGALQRLVLPDSLGTSRASTLPSGVTPPETAAAGYAGLATMLLAAPLAFALRRRRRDAWFFAALAVVGAGYALGLPPVLWLCRLPPLSLLQNHRAVVLTGFAVLTLGVLGLDNLRRGLKGKGWRPWMDACAVLCLLLGAWCVWHAIEPPTHVDQVLGRAAKQITMFGRSAWPSLPDHAAVDAARLWYRRTMGLGAVWCAAVVVIWLVVQRRPRIALPLAGGLILLELFVQSWGAVPQTDPSLDYPKRSIIAALSRDAGRICGVNCLPANLNQAYGLDDLRGYDAVDPARYVRLLEATSAGAGRSGQHARTQWIVPRLTPITRMLGLRYLIVPRRNAPDQMPDQVLLHAQDADWAVLKVHDAMPRVFIPLQIEALTDAEQVFGRITDPTFDPALIAYVETATPPAVARGSAALVGDEPDRVVIEANLEQGGLIVLADRFDAGWQATIDDEPARVLRVNYVLRGVAAPAGRHAITFTYRPRSFTRGVWAMGAALVILMVWAGTSMVWTRRRFAS